MATGTVKIYKADKGYGFITPEEKDASSKDIFVHISEVSDAEALNVGDRVSFDVNKGPKGNEAKNVKKID